MNTYIAPVGGHDSRNLPFSTERKRKDRKGETTPWPLGSPITIDHRHHRQHQKNHHHHHHHHYDHHHYHQHQAPAPPRGACTTFVSPWHLSRPKRRRRRRFKRKKSRKKTWKEKGIGEKIMKDGEKYIEEESGENRWITEAINLDEERGIRRGARRGETWRNRSNGSTKRRPRRHVLIREEEGERYGGASFRTKLGPWRRAGDPRGTPSSLSFSIFARLLPSLHTLPLSTLLSRLPLVNAYNAARASPLPFFVSASLVHSLRSVEPYFKNSFTSSRRSASVPAQTPSNASFFENETRIFTRFRKSGIRSIRTTSSVEMDSMGFESGCLGWWMDGYCPR